MTYDPPEILCIDLFANYYIFSTLIMISLLNRTTLHLHLISNEIHLGLIPTLMPTLDKTMLNLKCDCTLNIYFPILININCLCFAGFLRLGLNNSKCPIF